MPRPFSLLQCGPRGQKKPITWLDWSKLRQLTSEPRMNAAFSPLDTICGSMLHLWCLPCSAFTKERHWINCLAAHWIWWLWDGDCELLHILSKNLGCAEESTTNQANTVRHWKPISWRWKSDIIIVSWCPDGPSTRTSAWHQRFLRVPTPCRTWYCGVNNVVKRLASCPDLEQAFDLSDVKPRRPVLLRPAFYVRFACVQ